MTEPSLSAVLNCLVVLCLGLEPRGFLPFTKTNLSFIIYCVSKLSTQRSWGKSADTYSRFCLKSMFYRRMVFLIFRLKIKSSKASSLGWLLRIFSDDKFEKKIKNNKTLYSVGYLTDHFINSLSQWVRVCGNKPHDLSSLPRIHLGERGLTPAACPLDSTGHQPTQSRYEAHTLTK